MVRVSVLGQQDLLLQGIFQNQRAIADTQQQITTRKVSDEYKDLAGQTDTLLSSKSFLSRIESYQSTISTVQGRVDATAVHVGAILEVLEDFKSSVDSVVANNEAISLQRLAETAFGFIRSSLNTNFDGSFLFAGASAGEEPLSISRLAELVAYTGNANPTVTASDLSGVFKNSHTQLQARVADGLDLPFGLLADEVASEAFATLHNIYNFNQGPNGPFDGEITSVQRDFLVSQIQDLNSLLDNLRAEEVKNGLTFERLDVADAQHGDTELFLKHFISDIEDLDDIDLAAAISKLNNDQFALEASYRALATLNELSLLRFL